MSLGYLEIFGIVADCFQVLLCAVLLALLVRYRKKTLEPDGANGSMEEAGPFRDEFMRQSIRHQSELSFENIEKAIQTERLNLQHLFNTGAMNPGSDAPPPESEEISVESFRMEPCDPVENGDPPVERYRQVTRLAADGLKAPRIAKQLGIPRGEVELVLKMTADTGPMTPSRELAVDQMCRRD